MCVPIHLPRTILDKEGLLKAHNRALRKGGLWTVAFQYLWDLALMIERCRTANVENIDWVGKTIKLFS